MFPIIILKAYSHLNVIAQLQGWPVSVVAWMVFVCGLPARTGTQSGGQGTCAPRMGSYWELLVETTTRLTL